MIRTLKNRWRSTPSTQHVHFHQGPQGHPMPCYDSHCPNPRLTV